MNEQFIFQDFLSLSFVTGVEVKHGRVTEGKEKKIKHGR